MLVEHGILLTLIEQRTSQVISLAQANGQQIRGNEACSKIRVLDQIIRTYLIPSPTPEIKQEWDSDCNTESPSEDQESIFSKETIEFTLKKKREHHQSELVVPYIKTRQTQYYRKIVNKK